MPCSCDRTNGRKRRSANAVGQAESYAQSRRQHERPNSALVGLVPAPAGTFEVTAYDIITDGNNKSGYHLSGTVARNWVEIARNREVALAERQRRKKEREKQKLLEAERTDRAAQSVQKF
jgi:hypothetical protein